jgi:hypothetical protein
MTAVSGTREALTGEKPEGESGSTALLQPAKQAER